MPLIAQLEEALALSSIFDELFTLLSSHGYPLDPSELLAMGESSDLMHSISLPLSYEVIVDVDASEGLRISDNKMAGHSSAAADESHESSVHVKHLPPVQLKLELPAGYPSSSGPSVTCHAIWLSADQQRSIEESLSFLWSPEEQIGYTCVDWIQHQALSLVCSGGTLSLPTEITSFSGSIFSPSDKVGMQMSQSDSTSNPILGPSSSCSHQPPKSQHFDLLSHLVRYDATLTLSDFKASTQTCGICFDQSLGSSFVVLGCGGGSKGGGGIHAYCKTCFTEHCLSLIQSGSVDLLRCPEPSCRSSIPPYILESILAVNEFEKYESLALNKALAAMTDLAWCPRCDSPTIADKDDGCSQCPSCFYVFCGKCLGAYHPAERCLSELEQLEMKQLSEERRQNTKLSEEDKRRKRADLVAQVQSMQLVQRMSKPCPCCGTAIEKSEGCNKMACSNCSSLFCWRCLQVIPKEVGYDHFGKGLCELFEQREIDRWEAMNGVAREIREARMRNQAMVAVMRGDREGELQMRPVNCRMCGQLNVREGNNNLIRCWACRGHTCAICREPLRNKPGQHFGLKEGQCRQHS